MTRQSVAAAVLMLLTLSGAASATVWQWRVRVRPPVSIQEALEIAEQLLGDDAKNRFCVNVSLWGNPAGAPKPGVWHLKFAAADGSQKIVSIDMDRKSSVSDWNQAVDWTKDAGHRADLEDVRARLQDLFKKEKVEVDLQLQDGHLIGKYRTRKYQIHKALPDGAFSYEVHEEIGPDPRGFIFDARITDQPRGEEAAWGSFTAPYWTEYEREYKTTVRGTWLVVRRQLGREMNRELGRQMDQAFGIDLINP